MCSESFFLEVEKIKQEILSLKVINIFKKKKKLNESMHEHVISRKRQYIIIV